MEGDILPFPFGAPARALCPLLLLAATAAPAQQACEAAAPPPIARSASAAPPASADDAARSREVDALFAPWAARAGPGVGVLVVHRGRVVHAAGYGMADVASRRPITPRTPFELASLTKQITGMAVVHLARQGGLRYRDSVAAYLPAFRARYPGVQVRDLLNHTGGFHDYIAWFRARGAAYDAFPRAERGADAVHEPTMAEMLDSLAAQPPRFPPGVGWAYDNTGYLLAVAVVEKASGVPFAEYVRNNLFRPAGMAASSFVDPYGPRPRDLAHSYTCGRGGWQLLDYTPLERQLGAVGVVSTLEDLGRWSMRRRSFPPGCSRKRSPPDTCKAASRSTTASGGYWGTRWEWSARRTAAGGRGSGTSRSAFPSRGSRSSC